MTISYNWLKQYIDLPESPEEIARVLTSTGLEVEGVHPMETVKGGLKGLVIGQVLTCAKHPNADKLSVTTVDVGGPAPLAIVCGAPNVAAGQKVVVAVPGSTVHPTEGEPFAIKATKIRGEKSEGMICAEDEIGLGKSHAGIMVLETTVPNGTLASEFFNIETDYILEIGLTPNRADAASHIGVARDIRAAKGRAIQWPSVDAFKPDNQSLPIQVIVENTEACPRYSGVTLTGITIKESPAWLKQRLISIGLSPINNVVDITNFVCHETGQPMHAFDAAAITGGQVVVKTLAEGTKFITLDNKERSLASKDLMICNSQQGMCIAGVFGGARSGISATTTSLFLESATFSPEYVRRTSNYHQLKTDASFRFSRGTDPLITVYALKRAALLIKELAGGSISSSIVDIYPKPVENRRIAIKHKNVSRLIGKTLPQEEIYRILSLLDIEVSDKTESGFTVSVPPYRVDVMQEADVVEEILRIYGFNNIELKEEAGTDFLAHFPVKDLNKFKKNIGGLLVANGYYEILTNSLTNVSYQQKHKLTFGGDPVEVLNKLSEELGILRQTMLFTGLEVCAYNFNRKQKDMKFFEFGKIYAKSGGGYHEEERLALYIGGNQVSETWQEQPRPVNYHDIAQAVAQVLERCAVSGDDHEPLNDPLFDYGLRLLHGGREVGRVGKVKAALTREFGLKTDIFYADLSTDLLFQTANPKFGVLEVSRFPEVKRDLSLILDKKVRFEEIRALVKDSGRKLIRNVTAFDVYEGDKIPEGKKAYALGFTLQDETKTLTDEEIDKTMNKLMAEFEQKLGAIIRK